MGAQLLGEVMMWIVKLYLIHEMRIFVFIPVIANFVFKCSMYGLVGRPETV